MRTASLTLLSSLIVLFAAGCGSNGSSARVSSNPNDRNNAAPAKTEQAVEDTETEETDAPPPKSEDFLEELQPELPRQEQPRSQGAGAPDPRIALYKPKTWPEASASRDGVAFLTISAPGWNRDFYQVDPRRGQASLGFSSTLTEKQERAQEEFQGQSAVFLTLRVHKSPAEARESLLRSVLAVTSMMKRDDSLGDVAFSARSGNALRYAAAVRGNISFIARSAEDGIDASVLAAAVDAAIKKSPVLSKGGLSKPSVTGLGAELAKTGQPNTLMFDYDRQSPKPEYMAFECSPRTSVSIVKNGEQYELYSGQAGSVTIKAFACSDRLQTSVFETEIEVVKGQ